jgi:aryl-alcohol dehydrogenase (NADP+)
MDAIDASLTRLGMDYVDLYQIHRWDYDTPIEETMEALHDVVKAGKARYIGASSMFAWQFAKAQYTADLNGWTRFVSMQNHYNLVYREEEREMIPQCVEQGVGLIPWSPLARGFLAGNRKREGGGETARASSDDYADSMYFNEEDFTVAERAQEIAEKRGVTSAQIALAWMLGKSYITAPIIGASKMPHLEQAIAALDIDLSEDEVSSLEEAYQPHLVLGHT